MSVVVSNSLSTTELMLEFCKPATSVMVATVVREWSLLKVLLSLSTSTKPMVSAPESKNAISCAKPVLAAEAKC